MSTTDWRPRPYYGWYIAVTCLIIAFVTVAARQAFGVFVVPMSDDFGWDRTTLFLAFSLGILVNGLSQPFLGYLFDRLGVRVILVSLVIVGLATASLALTFHIVFLAFAFGVVAATALGGVSLPITGALLARWFRRKRATVVGLNAAGVSVGGLVLVPFAAYLIEVFGWRASWAVLGIVVLAVSVPPAFLFLRDDPSQMGLHPDGA